MDEYSKTLNHLQNLCSKKECCSSDIFRKALSALQGDKEKAVEMLDSLIRERFVDDRRYASAFAREKSRLTGWGPAKISYTLLAKGISRNDISAALEGIDQDEADRRMRSVLETKAGLLAGDPNIKFKLLKFGLTRGYEYPTLEPVVRSILDKL
ncbi:MAG: RecX family transcriptional regulator [Bacteroidales bacterium]|nr:RecX family transcriptional regulator [Bacteroidales bacterium]